MNTEPQEKESPRASLHETCKENIKKALDTNPYLVKILESIEKKGCTLPPNFFRCMPCDSKNPMAAQFHHQSGIVVCENNLMDSNYVATALVHEAIHAYDYCRAKLDVNNLEHVACTEIRAANLSGDCYWKKEALRLYGHKWKAQHPACVRRRAELSVLMYGTTPEVAKETVEKVWNSCYKDLDPFDHTP